jgi:hypothetical protein
MFGLCSLSSYVYERTNIAKEMNCVGKQTICVAFFFPFCVCSWSCVTKSVKNGCCVGQYCGAHGSIAIRPGTARVSAH